MSVVNGLDLSEPCCGSRRFATRSHRSARPDCSSVSGAAPRPERRRSRSARPRSRPRASRSARLNRSLARVVPLSPALSSGTLVERSAAVATARRESRLRA